MSDEIEKQLLRRRIAANDTVINSANTIHMVGLFMAATVGIPALIALAGGGMALAVGAGILLAVAGAAAVISYQKKIQTADLQHALNAVETVTHSKHRGLEKERSAPEHASVTALEPVRSYTQAPQKEWGRTIRNEAATAAPTYARG